MCPVFAGWGRGAQESRNEYSVEHMGVIILCRGFKSAVIVSYSVTVLANKWLNKHFYSIQAEVIILLKSAYCANLSALCTSVCSS